MSPLRLAVAAIAVPAALAWVPGGTGSQDEVACKAALAALQ